MKWNKQESEYLELVICMIYLLYIVLHYNDTLAKKSRYTRCFTEAVLHDVYSKLSHQNIVTCFGILVPVPWALCMLLKKPLYHFLTLGFLHNVHCNCKVLFILFSTHAHDHYCDAHTWALAIWVEHAIIYVRKNQHVRTAAYAAIILCNWMMIHWWMRDDSDICCLFFELISTRFVMVL